VEFFLRAGRLPVASPRRSGNFEEMRPVLRLRENKKDTGRGVFSNYFPSLI
jgi:hypothetical protein